MKNFTQVPNDLWELELTGNEFYVLSYIVRKTKGWQKQSDGISVSQFMKALGMSKMTVIRSLKKLEEEKYISVQRQTDENGSKTWNVYKVNYDVIRGVVSKLDYPSLKNGHTKETITKETLYNSKNQEIFNEAYKNWVKGNKTPR